WAERTCNGTDLRTPRVSRGFADTIDRSIPPADLMSRLLPCLLLTATPLHAADGNWPMWRGPHGDGTSDESGFPTRWTATGNVVWKTPIPGKGHSSPIVWGDRIFVTTAIEEGSPKKDRLLLCIDRADGKVLWQKTVVTAPDEHIHKLNSRASSTPATDGERVY